MHPSQRTERTTGLLQDVQEGATVHVSNLWPLEVANSLLIAVRRRIMTEPERKSALTFLSNLNVAIDTEAGSLAWTTISDLAGSYNLSVYDAVHLELAIRKQLPLATRDGALQAAARRAAVELL